MKKLPNIFKPGINKNLTNNNKVYYSFIDNKENNRNQNDNFKRNIKKEVLSSNYFNKPLTIVTKNNEYKTKIIDRMGTNIITNQGKIIAIADIISIYKQ